MIDDKDAGRYLRKKRCTTTTTFSDRVSALNLRIEMPTIILGGGIVGSSVAYYLSTTTSVSTEQDQEIHVLDSATHLFQGASGYAAGFLAKDWFSPSVAPLGALSFALHEQLAETNDGMDKWGYMKGTAFSLDTTTSTSATGSDDWLREGTSRAESSGHSRTSMLDASKPPVWLTRRKGMLEKISGLDTAAQV